MNAFLKALIKEAVDAEHLAADLVSKAWAKVVPDMIAAGVDAPNLIGSLSSWKADLQGLVSNPAASADLLAYCQGLGLEPKAQDIVSKSAKLALDIIPIIADAEALVAAIKG